jgi:hypothetical protein
MQAVDSRTATHLDSSRLIGLIGLICGRYLVVFALEFVSFYSVLVDWTVLDKGQTFVEIICGLAP